MKFLMNTKQVGSTLLGISLLMVGACSDSTSTPTEVVDGDFQAVISAVSSDFGSSEISISNTVTLDDADTVDIDESLESYDIVNGYAAQDLSDITVATYGKNFYRLGRSSQNNITKYSFEDPSDFEWQFSVNSGGETGANPQDILFVSETKAYVLRYGSPSILIINPSVEFNDEESFQIGEIDLSAYDADGVPNMRAGVINDGKLYVVLQALDSSFVPGLAYLAVIDTTTDEELTVGSSVLKGLPLNIRNPIDLDLFGNSLYVSGIGRYGDSFAAPPRDPEFTGGIEKINIKTFSTQLLVDDGNSTTHPFGQVNGLAVVSETLGYFRGYAAWQSESLYQFNPSTGDVVSEPVTDFAGLDIRSISVSPEKELWVGVGDFVNPEIRVINPEDNSLSQTIYTDKIPSEIVFSGDLSE